MCCTEASKDQEDLKLSLGIAESLLGHINESIREQEGHERLKMISQDLWVGQGYGLPTHSALIGLMGL
jgi:actin cytoskeleton-regulatory complex protein PAN1